MKLLQLLWFPFRLQCKIIRFFYNQLLRILMLLFKVFGQTMGLFSCLSCCRKKDDKGDKNVEKREQESRQNFTGGRNTDRSTVQTETTLLSSSDTHRSRDYGHQSNTAPILSNSSRQSTYSTIPDRTTGLYDNVPKWELESRQLEGFEKWNLTESEVNTLQKPAQANIRQSGHYNLRSSSRVASYNANVQLPSSDKRSPPLSEQENKRGHRNTSKVDKIPNARKLTVTEIHPNTTTKPQGRQISLNALTNRPHADYSLQSTSLPTESTRVQVDPADTCCMPDPNDQPHSKSIYVNPKSHQYKSLRTPYQLSSDKANEIVQTTTTYLAANSTAENAFVSGKNKFPTLSTNNLGYQKSVLVNSKKETKNTRKNRSSTKTNKNFQKPYSVYDNVPVSINSNSSVADDIENFDLSTQATNSLKATHEINVKQNSKINLDHCSTVASEVNIYQPNSTMKSMEEVNSFEPIPQMVSQSQHSFTDELLASNKIKDEIHVQDESVSDQKNKRRKVETKLDEVENHAKQFIEEIDNFEESKESSQYYYFEESLRRLVDTLDDMYEDIGEDDYLRGERKKVYKILYSLFDKLDDKVSKTS